MPYSPPVQKSIEMCRYCFMCRHANSTFLVTKLDSHTPRGYALLLSEIESGLSEWTEDVAAKLYQSTLDGLCRELCEFHWPEDDVVRAGREQAVRHAVVPPPVGDAIETLRAEAAVPLPSAVRHRLESRLDREGAETLFLTGSLARREAPDLVLATASILDRCGEDWTVLGHEPDTGAALWELGLPDEASEAGARLAAAIRRLRPRRIVTGDAHVCRALRDLFPSWGIGDLGGAEVLHVAEYLAGRLKSGALSIAATDEHGVVAYHDPCQLGRRLRVFDAPREVVQATTGHAPIEFPHAGAVAECCGGGSLLHATYPSLSAAMGEARLGFIADARVDTVVTACPTCRLVLRAGAAKAGYEVKVIDIAELVACGIAATRPEVQEEPS
jgi:Fe-S oxidoreductase